MLYNVRGEHMRKYDVRKKEENLELKKRKKIFLYSVICVLLVIAVYVFTVYILTYTNIINQGYFRISDFVITSKVNVEELVLSQPDAESDSEGLPAESDDKIESDIKNDLKLSFNVSQENKISILVPKSESATISKVYLTNIKLKDSKNDIFIVDQKSAETNVGSAGQSVDIGFKENDNEYLIEFSLLNKNVIKEGKVPENINSVVYDGTIFKTLGYDTNNLKFTFEAKLNIEATNGKVSVCNISINLPNSEFGESGIVILREDIEKYNLKLKNKILEIFD